MGDVKKAKISEESICVGKSVMLTTDCDDARIELEL